MTTIEESRRERDRDKDREWSLPGACRGACRERAGSVPGHLLDLKSPLLVEVGVSGSSKFCV